MTQIGVSVTEEQLQELQRLAEEDVTSLSSMARKAMNEGLKVLKKKR